jgi:DNA-binding IclR family transcriptional regulator
MDSTSPFVKTLLLLTEIASRPEGAGFGELVRACRHMPRATLARQLKTLTADRLVRKREHTGAYVLAPRSIAFAQSLLRARPREALVQPVLQALASQTGESTAYFELDGDGVVLLAKVDMPDSWSFVPVHGRNTMLTHLANVCILAHEKPDVAAAALASRGVAGAEADAFRRKLAAERRRPSFRGAPIIMEDGRVIGAVIFSHLADRRRQRELRQALRSAARRITSVFAAYAT